jgi:hypothetical protein
MTRCEPRRWTYTDALLFFDTEVRVYFDNGIITKIETVE